MDSKLTSKEVFCAATDALTLGLTHDCIDDAERVLACLRAMRPRIAELDTFEAWILMKRGHFQDAARLLKNVADSPHGGLQAKALLTYCLFVTNDEHWADSANEIIEQGNNPDATHLMQLLVNPEGMLKEYEAAEAVREGAAEPPEASRQPPMDQRYVRA
jgi:type III secretion protein HrpB1